MFFSFEDVSDVGREAWVVGLCICLADHKDGKERWTLMACSCVDR